MCRATASVPPVSHGRPRSAGAGGEPGGEAGELLPAPLPEQPARLMRSPDPAGLPPDEAPGRLAHDGVPEEGKLVDRRSNVRILEVGRRRRLPRRDVPGPSLALALRLFARPRDRSRIVVPEDRAETFEHVPRHRTPRGEGLHLAVHVEEILAVRLETGRGTIGRERGEAVRHLLDRHTRLEWQRWGSGGDEPLYARRLRRRWRRRARDGPLPGRRAEGDRNLCAAPAHEQEKRLVAAPRIADHTRIVAAGPWEN